MKPPINPIIHDWLECTALIACFIGRHWPDVYQEDIIATQVQSVDLAKEFLNSFTGLEDEYLEALEAFCVNKLLKHDK